MRICFLSGDISRSGGTEKVACQIMNGLSDFFEVSVISLVEEETELFYELSPTIPHSALFASKPNGMKQYLQIVSAIRNKAKNADILVDIDTILDMFSVPAILGLKTKLIAWEHFNFEESMGNRFRISIRKHFTRFADCIVTLTKEDQKTYRRYFGPKKWIEQIYNPIILPGDGEYSITSRTIVSVGRLAQQKGFDYLVEIADIVLSKHPEWDWLVLGEGEERAQLERMRQEKKVDHLHFMGRVDDVYSYLQKSSIFVMTSRYEGFPLALIEAKAANLPVVAFSCKTGPAELIENEVNGYLVECFDCNQMAERICKLIEHPEIRQTFSARAAQDTEKMNYQKVIQQWRELINRMLIR